MHPMNKAEEVVWVTGSARWSSSVDVVRWVKEDDGEGKRWAQTVRDIDIDIASKRGGREP